MNKKIKNEARGGRLWNRNYILLMLENLFAAFSFNMISTILSQYLVKLGATLTLTGIIVGMFSVTALVIRPVSGVASDRYSKRNILIIANLLIGVSELGYVVSSGIYVVFIFRIIHGIAFGMSGTASIALTSEIIPEGRTGEGIGYMGLGQIIAVAVAPGLGIMVSEGLGYTATFVCAFILAAAASALLIPFKKNGPCRKTVIPPARHAWSRPKFGNFIEKNSVVYSIASGVMSFDNGVVTAYILMFSEQAHIGGISVYFVVSAIFMLIVRPLSGKIVDRKGIAVLAYPNFVIGVTAMFMHGFSTTLAMLLAASALKAVASSAIQSSLLAECVKRAGPGRSGVATSTFYIGADVGQGVGPAIGGAIASALGYRSMFYVCGFVTLFGGVMFLFKDMREKRAKAAGGRARLRGGKSSGETENTGNREGN